MKPRRPNSHKWTKIKAILLILGLAITLWLMGLLRNWTMGNSEVMEILSGRSLQKTPKVTLDLCQNTKEVQAAVGKVLEKQLFCKLPIALGEIENPEKLKEKAKPILVIFMESGHKEALRTTVSNNRRLYFWKRMVFSSKKLDQILTAELTFL